MRWDNITEASRTSRPSSRAGVESERTTAGEPEMLSGTSARPRPFGRKTAWPLSVVRLGVTLCEGDRTCEERIPASSFLLGVVRNDSDCEGLWPRLPADGEAPISELRACIEWRVSSTMRSTLRAHLGG